MSKIKSFVAIILVLALALSMVGCHPKDEVALTIGGVEITSAMYGCALIMADIDGRGIIDQQNGTVGAVDYKSQTIDNKPYEQWVEDRALALCKLYAAYTLKMKELNLTLSDDIKNNVYQECYYNWILGEAIFSSNSYTAYATLMEPNGVSFNTYYNFELSGGMDEAIFSYYYGDKGVKKIEDTEFDEFYTKNFALIYDFSVSYADKSTTDDKAKIDKFMADLKTKLEKGADYETLKAEIDEFEKNRTDKTTSSNVSSNTSSDATSSDATSSDNTSSDATSSGNTSSTEKEEPKAKDENAKLVWSSAAGSNSDTNFQNIITMEIGEVKLIETGKGWRLVKKLDLMSDTYYRDINYLAVANKLRGEDFGKEIEEYSNTLEVVKNDFAMGQYTLKKLDYTNA